MELRSFGTTSADDERILICCHEALNPLKPRCSKFAMHKHAFSTIAKIINNSMHK
jgi:hypothetical protein